MAKNNEVKIVVEYILKLPPDIQVNEVEPFLNNSLDEGTDAESVISRIIKEVEFAEKPGLVETSIKMTEILGQIESISEDEELENEDKVDIIQKLSNEALDEIEKKAEE